MGDLDKQRYLVKIYYNTKTDLLRYITVKCSDTEDIQDILQNTYLQLWTRINKYGTTFLYNPKKYLLRIAHDETVKYYREKDNKKGVISTDDEKVTEISDETFLCEEVALNSCLSEQIWKEIKRFDNETVKIFTLRFVYDEKIENIAKQLLIPVSTVKSKLYRGLAKLKVILGENE